MSKIDKPTVRENHEIPDKMRAAVYDSDIEQFALVDGIPVPTIGTDEVLLKVELCGVCGTDRKKILHNLRSGPRVFGHEVVGTVIKKGESVISHNVGDRVAVFHHVPCEECSDCSNGNFAQCRTYQTVDTTAGYGEPAGGGFAQFIRVPKLVVQKGLIPIPDNVSFEQAVGIEPLDCMHKAVLKADLKEGDRVAIEGFGPIGQAICSLAQHYGAEAVDAVDINPFRSDIANVLESDFTLVGPRNCYTAEGLKCIPFTPIADGLGFIVRGDMNLFEPKEKSDVVFVATEQWDAILNAIDHVKPGGKVIFVFDLMADAPEIGFIAHQEISLKSITSEGLKQVQEQDEIIDIKNSDSLNEVWIKIKKAIKRVNPGGTIVLHANSEITKLDDVTNVSDLSEKMATFLSNVINKQLTVIGSYSSSGIYHHKTAELVFSGKVVPFGEIKIITLDQIGEAICKGGVKYVIRH